MTNKIIFQNWRKFALVESEEQSLGSLEKKYPEASPNELLANPNCGIGSDGRFVVLDSSFFG